MRLSTLVALTTIAAAVAVVAPASGATNAAPNPGFEDDCGGIPCQWSATTGATVARSTSNPHGGAASLRVIANRYPGGGGVSDCVPISPGTVFASVWHRTDDADVSRFFIIPNYYSDAACIEGGIASGFTFSPTPDGQWHLFSGSENVAPPETQAVRIVLSIGCDACQSGMTSAIGHFDDVSLSQTPTAVAVTFLRVSENAGGVLLGWRTAVEAGTLGFNAFRDVDGRLEKLNRTLIPSVFGGTTKGHSYSWLDRSAPRDNRKLRYRLQAGNLDGTRSWIGVTSVRRSIPR